MSLPQAKKSLSTANNQNNKKDLLLTDQMNDSLGEEEQVFLRTDVNQLFDNMMVSANFNFKKYTENRQQQTKKNSKRQSIDIQLQKPIMDPISKGQKIFTQPSEGQKGSEYIFTKPNNKKNQTAIDWNFNNTSQKKEFLKTDNLNKLLKKKDSLSFTNGNKEVFASKSVKVNFPATSTYISQKGEDIESEFASTKYGPSSSNNKGKNTRRKIMSMTSKGNRAIRVETQSVRQDDKPLTNLNRTSSKRVQTETPTQIPASNHHKKNGYPQLQKKYNKGGPLKFRHVQNWLNNIIQQYCHDQYFDTSLTSSALKKYYIDSNSLMSNGVDPADVTRIYNSLFVYSIGFNNLIKQISKGNRELVKNIWKVYSLLLEYCAAGNYQTLVGEIERDKLRKVEELKVEIERRQEIIEKNEELNEQKNMTMYKELKRLKDENFNLANERQILMEDFQQADQAFNEEVSLRLKFQNTINEIYGVHKELQNKHGRLYNDFQQKMQELKRSSDKYFQQTKQTQKFKYELIDLKEKYNELMKINSHDKEHIDVLLAELEKMKENYFITLKELQESKYISVEKDRKMEQVMTQLQNNRIILELREKSAKETHTQYRITLEENNKLFSVISEQRVEMQSLLKEKKDFNQNVLKILADSTYYKKKHQAAQIQLKSLNQKLIQAETTMHKTEVQNDIFTKQVQSLKNDLANNYQNIKKMHAKNFQLEEELGYLRKYEGNMDNVIEEKNKLTEDLKLKVDDLERRLMQETHDFMNLESKYKILETQFRAEKELNVRRVEEFRKEQELMCTNQSSLSKLLNQTHQQLDKFKTMWNNTLMDLKNEKFERSNLTLNYEQILKVLEKKNADEKQASIMINELEEEVLEYKEKYKLTHLSLINTTQELNLKIYHLKQAIAQQKQIIDRKAHHYHPMLFQDLYHRYQRQIEAHQRTTRNLNKRHESLFKEKVELEKSMKRQKGELQYQMDKAQKEFKKSQEKLKGEIQYMKEENEKSKKKLMALEMLQTTYKEKVKVYEGRQTDEKRQTQLLEEIKSKNTKITVLYEEIERVHDLKRAQIVQLQKNLKIAEEEKINFVYEFKQKKEREIYEEIDKKYQEQVENMKQEYQQRLKMKDSSRLNSFRMNSSKNNKGNEKNNGVSQRDQDLQNYFRELVKQRTLEELLLIKKQQFDSINEPENNKFFDQVQDFFRRTINSGTNNGPTSTNNFFGLFHNNTTQKDFSKILSKAAKDKMPGYLQRFENEQSRRRASISRKLKIAYDYYNNGK